jgi:hypothetical protein
MLGTFGIISVNVNPAGLPQGKGYRRVDFEEAWERYCPGQIASRTDSDISIRPSVHKPVESAQVSDFSSVHEASVDGSKNGKLSYSHAGLDGWTDKKPESGARNGSATTETPSDDPGDIPDDLVRTGHRCNYCGSQFGLLNHWAWPGYPDGIRLHERCEAAWHDSEGRLQ